jgi:hypothetical protein
MLLLTKNNFIDGEFLLSVGELAGFMESVPLDVDIWRRGS